MEQATELLDYIWVVIVPCISSICASLTAIILAIRQVKKAVKDPNDNIRDLRNEYKALNKTNRELLEENKKLYKMMQDNQKQLELLRLEVENYGQEK